MKLLIPVLIVLLISACSLFGYRKYRVYQPYDKMPVSRNNGTCKELKDTVGLYAIFVDVGIYHPWTEFDIECVMDSIHASSDWIENQAKLSGKDVHIKVFQHKQNSKLTIKEKSAKTALHLNGLLPEYYKAYRRLSPWAQAISKYAGRGLKYRPSSKIAQRLKITDVNTFTMALRDKLELENVAVMFFVNGYMEGHPSYSFNVESGQYQQAEYSIITSHSKPVIAHEFLHLFGAVDLYANQNFPNFNYQELNEAYPNEIMYVQHKDIEDLMISPINRYFVGWQDTLAKSDNDMLFHKIAVPEY